MVQNLGDFEETALKLIDVADFTPRYYIYDGTRCSVIAHECGNQCISDGRTVDPTLTMILTKVSVVLILSLRTFARCAYGKCCKRVWTMEKTARN